jgi:hypothetical protein
MPRPKPRLSVQCFVCATKVNAEKQLLAFVANVKEAINDFVRCNALSRLAKEKVRNKSQCSRKYCASTLHSSTTVVLKWLVKRVPDNAGSKWGLLL